MDVIPEIIHFVWTGTAIPQFAESCINRFQTLNPDFKVMVHDEQILAEGFSQIYSRVNNICSKSDLLRLSALKKFGGWYFDTDFYPLRSIREITDGHVVNANFFVTRQTSQSSNKEIANGIIGLSIDSPVWPVILGEIESLQSGDVKRTTFGPILMTRVVHRRPDLCTVGEQSGFYPFSVHNKSKARSKYQELVRSAGYSPVSVPGRPYCIHLWAGGKDDIRMPSTLKLPGEKTAVVVANNRGNRTDYCHAINSAELVLRINRCIGFGDEQKRMGYKTDVLGIVSSGTSAKRFTKPIGFMRTGGRVREQIREVWFARPKGFNAGPRSEVSDLIIQAQSFEDLNTVYPSISCWKSLEEKLQNVQKSYVIPSTGMILIEMLLTDPRYQDYKKYLVGFSHEGWRGHPFHAEKTIIQQYIEEGKLFRVEDL